MSIYKFPFGVLFLFCVIAGYAPFSQAVEHQETMLDGGRLEEIFIEIITENSPWPRHDLEVDGFACKPATLTIPAGTMDYRLLNQSHNNYLGKKTLSLAIVVDGKEVGRVKMNGDLRLYGDVVCTTKKIDRHTILTEDDVTVLRRDISMLEPNIIKSPEASIGKRLKTSLRAGAVLKPHLLENPPLVKRGDLVTIMAQSDNLQVTTPGEVRNAGALGKMVRVKNLMSRREIYARVLNPGVVETEF